MFVNGESVIFRQKSMNKRQRDDLWREYRRWPKWYYHMVFDSLETGELFNDEGEYANGMNIIAIGQYIHRISILTFNLMVNHGHFLASATGNDLVNFFIYVKKRLNAKRIEDGHQPLPANYGFKLIRIKDERQLADTMIYIAKNPFKACSNLTASGYIWGSGNLIFSEISRLFEKVSISDLPDKFRRERFRTRVKLPDDYFYNKTLGFILPESYVVKGKVEKVLKSSWNYNFRLIRDIEAYVNIAEGLGDSACLSDEEVNMIIKKIVKDDYKADSVLDLGVDDRCRLAIALKKKYRLDTKRISRKVHLEYNLLTKLFG